MQKRIKLKDDEYFKHHKFKLYPNEYQQSIIDDFINQYRFVYNWGIEMEEKIRKDKSDGKSEYGFYYYEELREIFREYKKDLLWFTLPNETTRNALKAVEQAYMLYFKGINKYPKFKSKKNTSMSFTTRHDRFHVFNDCIAFETYQGTGRNAKKISLGFDSGFTKDTKYYSPVISRDKNGDYYVSFTTIEKKKSVEIIHNEALGVDLGIRNTFTTSQPIDGKNYHHQPWNTINKYTSRVKRLDKQIDKDNKRRERQAQSLSDKTGTRVKVSDIPKSNRQLKREEQRRKAYRKIHNIKDTYYHTITKKIVTSGYSAIGIEDLKDIKTNRPHHLGSHLAKVSFYTIRTYIDYKGDIYGVPVYIVDKDYPSSQICSCCGHQQKMPLGTNTYICPVCGNVMDRDLNAAVNLEQQSYNYYYGISYGQVA